MKRLFSAFLLFSVFAYGQDLTPPTFNGVELSPSSAANGDVISVIVDALDDTSGIDRIQIDIRNPEGEQLTSAFSSLSNWTDLGNNRYSYDVTINEFAISGDWYVSAVYIHDIAGNMFSDSFTSTNSPYILSVTSTTPDVTPPTFNGVEFSPSSAANGDVISVIVDALDDTSGIDRIQIDIRNPEGEQLTSAFSSLSNWTDLGNNRYSYDVTINEFAISGDWYVSAVYIHDIAGNMFSDSFTSTNSPYIISVGETTSSTRDILLNGTISAESNQIKNVADPTDAQDAVTKNYTYSKTEVDALINEIKTELGNQIDNDGDGYSEDGGDCDDSDSEINPSAGEVCDNIDNNCNSEIDEGATNPYYQDVDGDGFGLNSIGPVMTCSPPEGYVSNNQDCDDSNSAVYPGAPEISDGIDNDCDGQIDDLNESTLNIPSYSGTFDGATVTDGVFEFPSTAQPWAGFLNENQAIYPLSFPNGGKVTFTGATADTDIDVYFRFEANPWPDTEPSYNSANVTVTGTEPDEYTVEIPPQGTNTFNSAVFYLVTRDQVLIASDFVITSYY